MPATASKFQYDPQLPAGLQRQLEILRDVIGANSEVLAAAKEAAEALRNDPRFTATAKSAEEAGRVMAQQAASITADMEALAKQIEMIYAGDSTTLDPKLVQAAKFANEELQRTLKSALQTAELLRQNIAGLRR